MPQNIRPAVRGGSKVRALLIGNPTDDLPLAEREVEELATQLLDSGRFQVDEDDVLIGSERCQWLPLLNTLNSGRYGLIHYSGHSKFDGTQSAWQLKDAKITTALLTDALQKEPPAMVVSSSCESAAGEQAQQMLYENQTFDLPSAFLQAGVQTYVGTLWSVGSSGAYSFIREFYRAFLGGHALGECVRDGKKAISSDQPRTDRLAFVLYGDPQTRPGDLFPAMQTKEGT
jgi:CHAT domain-containing protein